MRRVAARGFTLLEVLIAVTLLSLITSMVYANFSVGLRSYKKGMARGDLFQGARGGMRLMEADLARMIPGKGGDTMFSSSSVAFNALQEGVETRMVRVTYTVSGGTLSRGLAAAGEQQGQEGAAEQSSTAILAEGVTNGAFEFFDGESWIEEIKEEDRNKSFLAARVKMTMQSGDEEGGFRTVFLLPAERRKEEANEQPDSKK
jgi:prepilin-type N-terminal cleavage/methylation domain-containing protein